MRCGGEGENRVSGGMAWSWSGYFVFMGCVVCSERDLSENGTMTCTSVCFWLKTWPRACTVVCSKNKTWFRACARVWMEKKTWSCVCTGVCLEKKVWSRVCTDAGFFAAGYARVVCLGRCARCTVLCGDTEMRFADTDAKTHPRTIIKVRPPKNPPFARRIIRGRCVIFPVFDVRLPI